MTARHHRAGPSSDTSTSTSTTTRTSTRTRNVLRDLVAINEAAKVLRARAFEVKLLALNAMITSTQEGVVLPAFNEVASRMRGWAAELEATIDRLVTSTSEAVAWVSRSSERERRGRIVAAAAQLCATPRLADEALARVEATLAQTRASLEGARHAIHSTLRELGQSGLMATVLSRSALIEATRGPAEVRVALSQVAREFADAGQRVLDIINDLREQVEQR